MGFGNTIDKILEYLSMMETAFDEYKQNPNAKYAEDGSAVNETLVNLKEYDNSIKLDATLQNQFEQALDADLSDVRIHTGKYAEELTRQRGADAVTIGNDIYFASDKYSPDSSEGVKLIAHELEHVVQFKSGKRLEYPEDFEELEEAAGYVEKTLTDTMLFDMPGKLSSAASDLLSGAKDGLAEGLNDLLGRGKDKLEELSSKGGIPQKYSIILSDGSTVELTSDQVDRLFKQFKTSIYDWLGEQQALLSDEEFDVKINKFMKVVGRES